MVFDDRFRSGAPLVLPSALIFAFALAGCGSDTVHSAIPPATAALKSAVGSGFRIPKGIAVDGAGAVYVADGGSRTVEKVSPPFTGPTNGTIENIGRRFAFKSPEGVAVDRVGNAFVVDSGLSSVVRIAKDGSASLVGSGFRQPRGIAVDSKGNVYVADYGNGRVVEVTPPFTGKTHGTILPLHSGFGTVFILPSALSVDAAGDVYGTNDRKGYSKRVFRFDFFELGTAHLSLIGLAPLDHPLGIAADTSCVSIVGCRVFATDTRARRVDEYVNRAWSSIGIALDEPHGIALDSSGNLYVSDSKANAVWRIPL